MNYADILKRTWKVMRTEKAVWFFVLLANVMFWLISQMGVNSNFEGAPLSAFSA